MLDNEDHAAPKRRLEEIGVGNQQGPGPQAMCGRRHVALAICLALFRLVPVRHLIIMTPFAVS
ncbi:Uncharacterised protein [Mycobacteroides abscessus subsp. abscessus]|nr:Uncharacterised protein [Mycobacteroides abscessus subsp. abscessus]